MHNDELDEKKLHDFVHNTTVRIVMTVEQASEIYTSVRACADRFRKLGLSRKADDLETLASHLMANCVICTLDE